MKQKNVLLVIVDCLRYDRVSSQYMPRLSYISENNPNFTAFNNCWSVTHCTDPSITMMLTGMHPDQLKLYSMMYGTDWNLPEKYENIFQLAKRVGYTTGFVTNLGRWYSRGVDVFVDSRNWVSKQMFTRVKSMISGRTKEPWIVCVHTDAMHAKYEGGSYDASARITDRDIAMLLGVVDADDTLVIVTSDHGEGLGQAGPDGHVIDQHGYGLWDFLTHIPLVSNVQDAESGKLLDNLSIFNAMRCTICGEEPRFYGQGMVFQAGATPTVFHRGVVLPERAQLVRDTRGDKHTYYYINEFLSMGQGKAEEHLINHCRACDVDYGNTDDDAEVLKRLEGLGYWG